MNIAARSNNVDGAKIELKPEVQLSEVVYLLTTVNRRPIFRPHS
jgi:hypothetical protein